MIVSAPSVTVRGLPVLVGPNATRAPPRGPSCCAMVSVPASRSPAIARDLVGLGPYDQALKRKGLTREAEYEHHGTEPPNPYDLALQRRSR